MLKIRFLLKLRAVLFLNILFILGFWNPCHQSTSSALPQNPKNPDLTQKQSLPGKNPPLPQRAPIDPELKLQLPIRQFLSIFVGEFLEMDWETFDEAPKSELAYLDKNKKERKIKKLKALLPKQNGIDKDFGEAILQYIQKNEKNALKTVIQKVTQQLSNPGEKEGSELDKMNQWLTICSQFGLGATENKTSSLTLTKNGKLPFAHVLNLIFLIWEEFNSEDILPQLNWIKSFSQARALELLSLASVWLEDFLENHSKTPPEKIAVANFCINLGESDFFEVALKWLKKCEEQFDWENGASSNEEKKNAHQVILAIALSQAQFSQEIVEKSRQWIKKPKTLNFIKKLFSDNQLSIGTVEKKMHIALELRQILNSQEIENWLKKEVNSQFITNLRNFYSKNDGNHLFQYCFQSGKKNLLPLSFDSSKFKISDQGQLFHLLRLTEFFSPSFNGLKSEKLPDDVKNAWTILQNKENDEEYILPIVKTYIMSEKQDLINKAKKIIQDKLPKDSMNFLNEVSHFLKILDPKDTKLNTFLQNFKACLSLKLEEILQSVKDLLLFTREPNHNTNFEDGLKQLFLLVELELCPVDPGQEWMQEFLASEKSIKTSQGYLLESLKSLDYFPSKKYKEWILCCSSFMASF